MSVYSGDFLGFRLGNVHSSQLNITRVSNNDRYTENLTPLFRDQTADVPGGDGLYYWGSTHSQQTFIIDFAFDDVREEDLRRIRRVLSFKGVQDLIFDETPYKKYIVKCQDPPTLKYLAFDVDGITVYKGEGSIKLIAYYPYGVGIYKTELDSYQPSLTIANMGDIEAPVRIFSSFQSDLDLQLFDEDNNELGRLTFQGLTNNGTNDVSICIDTKTYLVEGLLPDGTKSGNLYNKYLINDRFFNVPAGNSILQSNREWSKVEFNNLYY